MTHAMTCAYDPDHPAQSIANSGLTGTQPNTTPRAGMKAGDPSLSTIYRAGPPLSLASASNVLDPPCPQPLALRVPRSPTCACPPRLRDTALTPLPLVLPSSSAPPRLAHIALTTRNHAWPRLSCLRVNHISCSHPLSVASPSMADIELPPPPTPPVHQIPRSPLVLASPRL